MTCGIIGLKNHHGHVRTLNNDKQQNESEGTCFKCGAESEAPLCKKCLPEARKEQIKGMNQTFYEGYAENLFSISQLMAVACLGEPNKVLDILENEISYENLIAGIPKDKDRTENISQIQKWARIEIESTYSHAIETLLRLFIGHAYSTLTKTNNGLPLCPWLEISNLRNFTKFKKLVTDISNDEPRDQLDIVAKVFFLLSNYPKTSEFPWTEDEWHKAIENVQGFLSYFANDYIENYEYNAFKHGLVVFPGERGLSIQAESGAGFSQKGESIVSLFTKIIEPEGDSNRYEVWAERCTFIETDIKISFIDIASRLIRQILEIGKARYVDKQPVNYQTFFQLSVLDVLTKSASYSRQKISCMSRDLWPIIVRKKMPKIKE